MQVSTSKKIKANKVKEATTNLGNIAKYVKVPQEINEKEKHLYHVMFVEAQHNPTTLETTYKTRVQMYNKKSWEVSKKRLVQIGLGNSVIIHDPTAETGEVEEKKPSGNDKRKELIEEAKSLGYEGALNVKNQVFEDFIEEAKKNAETGEVEEDKGE